MLSTNDVSTCHKYNYSARNKRPQLQRLAAIYSDDFARERSFFYQGAVHLSSNFHCQTKLKEPESRKKKSIKFNLGLKLKLVEKHADD